MTPEEQLDLWCAGRSVHNDERQECCPDFSCCNPKMDTPIPERLLFRDRPELRQEMLFGYLGKALAMEFGPKVHVITQEPVSKGVH